MKTAFLFPGQGSQYVGMGKEFFDSFPEARETFETADQVLGSALSELCFSGPKEELAKTVNTQPAVLVTSVACYRVLSGFGFFPAAVAGHSLGEYSALVASGAFRFADAVRLVRERGQSMQEAVPLGSGGMLAVLGLDLATAKRVCAQVSSSGVLEIANFNCPGQIVLAGHVGALENAVKLARAQGAKKCVPLAVSGPFHSSLMRNAAERLAVVLSETEIFNPKIPIVSNVSADYLRWGDDVRTALLRQVYSPVRWEESVRRMLNDGVGCFVEVGPGSVLSGLVKRIAPRETILLNVENMESLEKSLARLREVG
ncbi:MAG: ACP S-malonyltransferase [Firmicutes bacterium]|nr:ACP S-malonyltransferase [Bacillota bacterium]MBU4554035.1 ACP S-malonyltransferase [Bacillota bacterium]MBV1726616.1 ACP S-malonyltransferase [Desulforudis sp.]MBV1734860.1 ACP S-malonyltransferase [Desulforudis sp.]MBV1769739.1 ACP S-malonyltransferase [Desulforudis sp.]